MLIGVPKEVHVGELRVAATPKTVERLSKLGHSVLVESGAGAAAQFMDEAYRESGAEIVEKGSQVWNRSDLVIKVRAPEPHPSLGLHEAELLRQDGHLISFIWPAQNEHLMERLLARKASVLAVDSIPRISRAQKCDALSSMANIVGYRAVIEAMNHYGRFLGGQTTAAGNVAPAKVLVIGAGVAGLSAVGTAARLGAVVRAFDTRPEVREQVESLGAEFLEISLKEEGSGDGGYGKVMSKEFIQAEMNLFARQAMEVDIIITTALIPGKPAPRLITEGMVESMREGSVIMDLAAEQGGNCELTVPGKATSKYSVAIIGFTDLASRMAAQSSEMYSNNLYHLIDELTPDNDGKIIINMDDELIRGATVLRNGDVTWPPPTPAVSPSPEVSSVIEEPRVDRPDRRINDGIRSVVTMLIGGSILYGIGLYAPASFMVHFTIFILSCFVGWQVIWNVTPALHTPLMSVTNAISGIVIVGPLLMVSNSSMIIVILSAAALIIASINIAGGFVVTQRMLQMFRKS